MTLTGESLQTEGRTINYESALPAAVCARTGDTDPRHPYASPVFADYAGLLPLLIQVGEHEIIRDDSCAAAVARAAGVDVTPEVWRMFHVFPHTNPSARRPAGQRRRRLCVRTGNNHGFSVHSVILLFSRQI